MPAFNDPLAQLREELTTPLAVTLCRAQLLARVIRHSSTLNDDERECLLHGLTVIEEAAHATVAALAAYPESVLFARSDALKIAGSREPPHGEV